MSELEAFVSRVRALVSSFEDALSGLAIRDVEHLVDHNEIGEALCALAWAIVNEDAKVPAPSLAAIRELSEGLVDPKHMPPDLDLHATKNTAES